MLERRWGRVINIASLAGLHGAPYVTAYTASKHALVGFTRALAAEVSGKGVTVNAICPGFAATDLVWEGARNIAARTGRSFDDAVAALARLLSGALEWRGWYEVCGSDALTVAELAEHSTACTFGRSVAEPAWEPAPGVLGAQGMAEWEPWARASSVTPRRLATGTEAPA